MLPWLARRWFLTALALILALGFGGPRLFEPLALAIPQHVIVAVVLFLMALPLPSGSMWQAVRRPLAVLTAVGVNSVLVPLVAWGVAQGLPVDLGHGLLIAGSVPCTLASAAAWTRRAGGNDTVALLVMMITNVSCFVVTPGWLWLTTGSSVDLGDPWAMIGNLALLVVLPMVLAQLLRLIGPLGDWATRQKIPLGVTAQCGILVTVFCGAVRSGVYLAGNEVSMQWYDWPVMLLAVVAVHTFALFAGVAIARRLGLSWPDQVAVAFSGSQKTLMVGIAIANQYFAPVAMLPMLAYHVCQLLIDTVVADRWSQMRRVPSSGTEGSGNDD